jgi:hypothetical protein
MVVTTEAGNSTYMSMDGSMVRLLMKEEPIAACGRLVTGSNYPTLFLAKPQDNPSIGRRLNPRTQPSLPTSMHRMNSCTIAHRGVSWRKGP